MAGSACCKRLRSSIIYPEHQMGLVFTDADTGHAPQALHGHAPQALHLMVGHAVRHGDDLLSMFTDLTLVGPATGLLTPIGALILIERATPEFTSMNMWPDQQRVDPASPWAPNE